MEVARFCMRKSFLHSRRLPACWQVQVVVPSATAAGLKSRGPQPRDGTLSGGTSPRGGRLGYL